MLHIYIPEMAAARITGYTISLFNISFANNQKSNMLLNASIIILYMPWWKCVWQGLFLEQLAIVLLLSFSNQSLETIVWNYNADIDTGMYIINIDKAIYNHNNDRIARTSIHQLRRRLPKTSVHCLHKPVCNLQNALAICISYSMLQETVLAK